MLRSFVDIISLNPHEGSGRIQLFSCPFTEQDTSAQRREVIGLGLHNKKIGAPTFSVEPGVLDRKSGVTVRCILKPQLRGVTASKIGLMVGGASSPRKQSLC